MKEFKIIAKTFKGLEEVVAKELVNLGADEVQIERRAVSCKGNKAFLYKANLHCRTASRFLVPIANFEAKNADEVYEQVKKINWELYIDLNTSFSIDSTVFSDLFTHSKFVAYRVKDAIVDQFSEKFGKRPSVSITNPDLMINVHIAQTHCTISVDSSGESLHKRGYRNSQTEAPINEALAAGMLLLAGWDGKTNFIDPMCGSGTFLIEAALIALNIPPGIFRKSFGFEKWKDFDKELFDELYNDDSYERDFNFKIIGSDVSPQAIKVAEQNIKSAGLSKFIELKTVGINDVEIPEGNWLMVTNPPYGERLQSEDLFGLYENIGRMLKFKFAGNQAWVISSDERCLFKIGLKPSQKIPLLNGDLDCFYCNYEIFSGKRNEYVRAKKEGE
ncbi:MAG: class I SAM-dependent RNA methyltransferase [Paludibacteraceae bacterium]|nr:class I SAM-dependent RNA methyltransferase [Paludibacteraceae bacterium]MBN2787297.1 class I SAM-dependent RNA methyltransferase [Paludibacteraceae bacterium]